MNEHDDVYWRDGPHGEWKQIDGKLKQIAVGGEHGEHVWYGWPATIDLATCVEDLRIAAFDQPPVPRSGARACVWTCARPRLRPSRARAPSEQGRECGGRHLLP